MNAYMNEPAQCSGEKVKTETAWDQNQNLNEVMCK